MKTTANSLNTSPWSFPPSFLTPIQSGLIEMPTNFYWNTINADRQKHPQKVFQILLSAKCIYSIRMTNQKNNEHVEIKKGI